MTLYLMLAAKLLILQLKKVEVKTKEVLQWFNINAMKANAKKCLLTTNE